MCLDSWDVLHKTYCQLFVLWLYTYDVKTVEVIQVIFLLKDLYKWSVVDLFTSFSMCGVNKLSWSLGRWIFVYTNRNDLLFLCWDLHWMWKFQCFLYVSKSFGLKSSRCIPFILWRLHSLYIPKFFIVKSTRSNIS